jgi:hypothetical protein
MYKAYEVIASGVVIDGKPCKVGSTISLSPRSGEAKCGLRFEQLKLSGKEAAADKAAPDKAAKIAAAKAAAAKAAANK